MAAHFGPVDRFRALQEQFFTGKTSIGPVPPGRWKGAADRGDPPGFDSENSRFPGYYMNELRLRMDRFRIPPRELQEMLPQQSLMLKVAAEALADARWQRASGPRTGVVIGLGLDQNTNNFQLRWWLAAQATAANSKLGLNLSEPEIDGWIEELRNDGRTATHR